MSVTKRNSEKELREDQKVARCSSREIKQVCVCLCVVCVCVHFFLHLCIACCVFYSLFSHQDSDKAKIDKLQKASNFYQTLARKKTPIDQYADHINRHFDQFLGTLHKDTQNRTQTSTQTLIFFFFFRFNEDFWKAKGDLEC